MIGQSVLNGQYPRPFSILSSRAAIMKRKIVSFLSIYLTTLLLGCGVIDAIKPAERIACVGTSITEGYVLPDEKNYPTKLQALIGTTDKVLNYGVGGTTLLKKGDKPYWLEQKYQFALQWKPTIVVIEFGTNDSKDINWQYKSDFKSNYVEFIKIFQQLPSKPKIYLCLSPPAFSQNFDVKPETIRKEIMPLVSEIAKETNAQVIDLYKPLIDKDSLFIDGVHPTAEGTTVLADEVYKAIAPK